MTQQIEYLFNISRLYLRWLFMVLIIAIVIVFILQSIKIDAWVTLQVLIYAVVSGLLIYAPLNLYFGAWRKMCPFELARSLIGLLISGTGISMLFQQPMPPLYSVVGGCLITVVTIYGMHRYCIRIQQQEEIKSKIAENEVTSELCQSPISDNRPSDDASIRGKAAIFQYGDNKYYLSDRQHTGKNTAAERFERKFIRFLEHAFEVPILAYQGTGVHYWMFQPKGLPGPIEFIVIGHEFNTACSLKNEQRWLLRVRESKPGWFSRWIGQLFPSGITTERDLGAYIQTQFSSINVDDKALFRQSLSLPVVVHELTEEQARDLITRLEGALENCAGESEDTHAVSDTDLDQLPHRLH